MVRGLRSMALLRPKKKPLPPRGLEGRVWLEKLQKNLTVAVASGPADRWSAEKQAELQEQTEWSELR
jgi:hypothetical protein